MKDKTKSILLRILIAILVCPILFATIFLDKTNYGVSVFIIFFAVSGAIELTNILNKKEFGISKIFSVIISFSLPFLTFLNLNVYRKPLIYLIIQVLILTTIFSIEIFSKNEDKWKNAINRVSGYSFITIYIGILTSCMMLIQTATYPRYAYLFLILFVFSNDTIAYIVGMLFGKWTIKPFAVSPKKSLAGFIGGTVGCMAMGVGSYYLCKDIYNNNIYLAVLTALLVSIASNVGDLFESALKRSVNIKDSGTMMLGRGGALDSIDSLIFASPIFLLLLKLYETIK